MNTSIWKPLPVLAQIAHWAGCLLGTAVVALFVVFASGEGPPPLSAFDARIAAVAVMLAGFILMWWKDWLGGVVSLIGLAWFESLEIAANGKLAGGLFPLFVVPGLLAIVAMLLRHFNKSTST